MIRIPHGLHEEFATASTAVDRLIKTDHDFRQIAERYDEVNRAIYRIESEEEPTSDEVLERLKKQRLKLKDEVAAILAKRERRM